MKIFELIFNFIDAILLLIKYKFLDIFWFYFWIFWCGEIVFYTVEKLLEIQTIVRWYDLAWLMVIFVMAFLTSYRLYVVIIKNIMEQTKCGS